MIIIPGAFTDERAFAPFAELVGGHVVDLPARSARIPQLHRGGLSAIDRALDGAIEAATDPPVLVGHSLGGLAALRGAQRKRVAALVLLMPAPPDGLLGDLARFGLRDPLSALKLLGLSASAVPVRRLPLNPPRGIYSTGVSKEIASAGNKMRVSESWLVLASLAIGSRIPIESVDAPTLAIAGLEDTLIPSSRVAQLASHLGAEFECLNTAHAFNEEPRTCRQVAEKVNSFLHG